MERSRRNSVRIPRFSLCALKCSWAPQNGGDGYMPDQPEVYLYLDALGIESLFAQTVDRVETEFTESRKTGSKDGAGVKLGIGKGIAALLGFEAGAKLDTEKTRSNLQSTKSTLTVENKLARLLAYLSASDNLILTLPSAIGAAMDRKSSVFVKCQAEFDMPQVRKHGGGIDLINEDGAALFEVTSLGKCKKVSMAASLAKFPRVRDERLGRISHEALFFQGHKGRNVPLDLFGNLRQIAAAECQIKPYALWT
jgi:hypothetical protein